MPKNASVFDLPPDAAAEARADAAAEADVKAGRVVPHESVRALLARLVKGEKVPPPSALARARRLDRNRAARGLARLRLPDGFQSPRRAASR